MAFNNSHLNGGPPKKGSNPPPGATSGSQNGMIDTLAAVGSLDLDDTIPAPDTNNYTYSSPRHDIPARSQPDTEKPWQQSNWRLGAQQTSLPSTTSRPTEIFGVISKMNGTLPKNFNKPLTCFYWHTNGYCNKSDAECVYAHWPTGLVAAAPIAVGGGQPAVAGRNAVSHLQGEVEREQRLRDWQASLGDRERKLSGRELVTEGKLSSIVEIITVAEATIATNRCVFVERRENMAIFADEGVSRALDSAIEALDDAKYELDKLAKAIEDK